MNIIKTTPCDILCIVHRIWVEGQKKQGGMDKILEYFRKVKKRKIILVEQPLYNKGETQVFLLSPQGETKLLQISLKHHKVFLSWLKEIIFNLKVSKALILKTNFFTTDPLCALPGILFPNKFHFRYYHCIDYANQRFNLSLIHI